MEAKNKGDSHQRSSFLPSAQFGGYKLTGYQADEAKKDKYENQMTEEMCPYLLNLDVGLAIWVCIRWR